MKTSRALLFILLFLTASCARNLNSNHYIDTSASGVVLEGTIVSARSVSYSEANYLANNRAGLLGGGIAGGLAGSAIGGGTGKVAAIVGGATVGAVAGAVAQSYLTRGDAIEYIIKIKRKSTDYAPKAKKKPTGDYEFTSETISVVQGTDVVLNEGQNVYVIYADYRPRVVARNN